MSWSSPCAMVSLASRPSSLVVCRERSAHISNFFINPEIAEIFCANEPTFSIAQIDAGKIVCIAMPQKFQSERLYINTILKLSYYFHALSRFDKPAEEREKDNLIILFADEGQEIITGAESAFADHRAAGVIREARATIVLASLHFHSWFPR
jgi:hypothetical protein